MKSRCFKCGKLIEDGEIVCDSKFCMEALKEFNKVLKRRKVEEYKKFEPVKKELSDLEIIVEKAIENGETNKVETK